ncbi:MAG: helix-turn-helix transcriptional regulator [Lachnospiraceae bacterium]|nr:helix-turn-helix transcriptional regulator [Lachnospiraceae bacterium]
MEIIEKLEEIMKKKKITAYQMEKDIGISQTTFSNWKKGRQPTVDKLIKILPYLEVTPNELFGYSQEQKLNENEIELLKYFKLLPEREQIKFIGRVEEAAQQYIKNTNECQSSNSKIG